MLRVRFNAHTAPDNAIQAGYAMMHAQAAPRLRQKSPKVYDNPLRRFLKASPTVLLWHWKHLPSWGRLYPPIPSPERPLQIMSGAEPGDTLPENVVESWEVMEDLPRGIVSTCFLPEVMNVNHVWCDGTIDEDLFPLLASGGTRDVFTCDANSWVLKIGTLC